MTRKINLMLLLAVLVLPSCVTGPDISGEVSLEAPLFDVASKKVIVTDWFGNHERAKAIAAHLRQKGFEAEALRRFDASELEPGEIMVREGVSSKFYLDRDRVETNMYWVGCSVGLFGAILPLPYPTIMGGRANYDLQVFDHDGITLSRAHGSVTGECREWWIWGAFWRNWARYEVEEIVAEKVPEILAQSLNQKPVLGPHVDPSSGSAAARAVLQRVGPRLIEAIHKGRIVHVERLLDSGVPAEIIFIDSGVRGKGVDFGNELHWLAKVEQPASVGYTVGTTALMAAAQAGQVDVARLLLERGAYPNSRDAENHTVLDQVVDLIMRKRQGAEGDDGRIRDMNDRISAAIKKVVAEWTEPHTKVPDERYVEMVSLLLEYGADPNLGRAYKDAKWFKFDDIAALLEAAGAVDKGS